MKVLLFLLLIAGLVAGQSDQTITDNQGRKIILRADKTWDFVTDERSVKTNGDLSEPDNEQDIADVLASLGSKLKKSEFETESQYRTRIPELMKNTVNPKTGKALNKTLFVVDGIANYSAESREYYFTLDLYYILKHGKLDFSLKHSFGDTWYTTAPRSLDTPRFEMSPALAETVKRDLRLGVYCIPVSYSFGRIIAVPIRYVAFNVKTNKVYAERIPTGPYSQGKPRY